jgi:hypothetical protein
MPRERAQRVGDIPLQKGGFNACDHQYHPPFQVRMILIEFVRGCHTARKGCHTPPSRVNTLLETPETQTRALPSLVRIRISYVRA